MLNVVAPILISAGCAAELLALEFDLVARQFEIQDDQELDFFRGVDIDDQGNVAYTAVAIDDVTLELTGSALLVNNRRVVASGDTIGSGLLGFVGKPDLSAGGTTAYSADVFQQGIGLSNTGAIVGDPSDPATHQLLAGRDTIVAGIALEGAINPTINDFGSLVYTGIYFDSNLQIGASAIVLDGAIVAATGNLVGNSIIDTVDHATINDLGDLAFEATLIDLSTSLSSTAIFINGQLTSFSGALTDGIRLTEVFAPSLNNGGDLAYVGGFFDADAGLHNTAIIVNGQALIQSGDLSSTGLIIDTIEDVAINSSGQLAFQATFIDPALGLFFEQGIFSTELVPEPSSLALLSPLILYATVLRRRHNETQVCPAL